MLKFLLLLLLFFSCQKSDVVKSDVVKSDAVELDVFFANSKNGNLEGVMANIKNGVDVNARGEDGYTALHFATKGLYDKSEDPDILPINEGYLDVVEYLVSKGADVNAKDESGNTPLVNAVYSGSFEIVKYLVEAGADVSVNAFNLLTEAVDVGNVEMLKYLVEAGVDPNFKSDAGSTLLHYAVSSYGGYLDIVKYLVSIGFDPSEKDGHGEYIIHYAVRWANLDIIKYLVSLGIDINVKTSQEDKHHPAQTSLKFAMKRKDPEIIDYLKSVGAIDD